MGTPSSLKDRADDACFGCLVVDDCQDAANSLGWLLKLWGFDYRLAFASEEAIRVAIDYQPDVVLLDLGMPNIDGCEVGRQIRRALDGKRVALVAVTGYTDDRHRLKAHEAGFSHYLVKPVEPEKLERLLHILQREAQAARNRPRQSPPPLPSEGELPFLLQTMDEMNNALAQRRAQGPYQTAR